MSNFFHGNDSNGIPRYRELLVINDILAYIESKIDKKNISKSSEGYELLASLLENHPRIGHVFSEDLFERFDYCCDHLNEENKYEFNENPFCFWKLFLSYGLSNRNWIEGELHCQTNSITEEKWAHLQLLFKSKLNFCPVEYFIKLLKIQKYALAKLLLKHQFNWLGHKGHWINFDGLFQSGVDFKGNQYPGITISDENKELIEEWVKEYKPTWIK